MSQFRHIVRIPYDQIGYLQTQGVIVTLRPLVRLESLRATEQPFALVALVLYNRA
jgi:hypothetical protein